MLYKIYITQGQGECFVDIFGSRVAAEQYIEAHRGEGSFRIEEV